MDYLDRLIMKADGKIFKKSRSDRYFYRQCKRLLAYAIVLKQMLGN